MSWNDELDFNELLKIHSFIKELGLQINNDWWVVKPLLFVYSVAAIGFMRGLGWSFNLWHVDNE